jgi:hypothetical protein
LLTLFAEMERMTRTEQRNPTCCCGHHNRNRSHPPGEPTPPCSCPSKNPEPAVPEASDDTNLALLTRLQSASDAVGASVSFPFDTYLTEGVALLACRDPQASLFVEGRDLLRALHILRC